ncbi:MAG: Wzz/FepE/Etk N-terminal domain-containing protein, partial [Vicinamibacterales bacterium]|nr:Wzz/FepE/Etk N-terminal domain-containing protein [Vicinamibacterales bacterium]
MTVRDTDSLANFGNLVAWRRAATLLTGALRRRWRAVLGLSLVFVAVGVMAAALLPRSYSTQARLLVKKNYVMPALANPKRAVPGGSEAATQAAHESVLSRESLERIIGANDLLARWDAERPFLLRAKDRVLERVRGPVPDADKLDALVEVLGKRISVDVTNDVVTVKATWVSRKTALDLTNSAVATFLESRRRFDVQTVADTLAILQKSAQLVRGQVEARLTEVVGHQRVATDVKLARAARRPAILRTGSAPRPAADGLDDFRIQARQARRLREAIEARHQEQVTTLETRLGERRSVLTARHPDIVALEHALAGVRPIPA